MMTHKFVKLLELNTNLKKLEEDELIEWIKHLISNQKDGKLTIVKGIFRELYNQGEINNHHLLDQLLNKSIECRIKKTTSITNSQRNKNINNNNNNEEIQKDIISNIPENILSDIIKYLTNNELLTKWNLICYKFIKIGLKPHSIEKLSFKTFNSNIPIEYRPKFKLNSILSKVNSIDTARVPHFALDIPKLSQFPQSLYICM